MNPPTPPATPQDDPTPNDSAGAERPPLERYLGVSWPTDGPLYRALQWGYTTTDAHPTFLMGALLPVWSHYVTINRFVPRVDGLGFRTAVIIVGQPASSKSTSMRRMLDTLMGEVFAGAGLQSHSGKVQASGSMPGLFEALAERYMPDLGLTPAILHHDEVSALLSNKRDNVAEFLCQLADGQVIERHLRGVKAQNRVQKGSLAEALNHHCISWCFATTPASLRKVTDPTYLDGGLYSRPLWIVGPEGRIFHQLHWDLHRGALEHVVKPEFHAWQQWADAQHARLQLGDFVRIPVELSRELEDRHLEGEHSPMAELRAEPDGMLMAIRKRGLEWARNLARLFALNGQRTTVTDADMKLAVGFVRLSTANAERLLRPLASTAANPVAIELDNVFRVIAEAYPKGVRRKTFYQRLPVRKVVLDETLDQLLDEGAIEQIVQTQVGPGRPAQVYRAVSDSYRLRVFRQEA
jgi:hypothetical protein